MAHVYLLMDHIEHSDHHDTTPAGIYSTYDGAFFEMRRRIRTGDSEKEWMCIVEVELDAASTDGANQHPLVHRGAAI